MQTPPTQPDRTDTDDVKRAEQQVTLRKAQLSRSLHDAENTGKRLARQLGHQMKPALVAAIAVASVALLTTVAVSVVRRRSQRGAWLAPDRPSALGAMARGAGLWLVRLAVRRIAEEVAERLADAPAGQSPSVAASPNQV